MTSFKIAHDSADLIVAEELLSVIFKHKSNDEHCFFTIHSEYEDTPPWPYRPYDRVVSGSSNAMYHYCISTFKLDEDNTIRRRKQNFSALHAIVLDDIGTKVKPNSLEPTYKIETSPGNFQWGYVLSEPIRDAMLADSVIQAIYSKEAALSDTGGAQITKMVKFPLGKNLKPKYDGFNVRLVELAPERLYTWQQLIEAWGLVPGKPRLVVDSTANMQGLNSSDDELFVWLRDNGQLLNSGSNGYYKVDCPRGHEHSGGAAAIANYSPLGEGPNPDARHFKCFHEHGGEPPTTNEFLQSAQLIGGPKVSMTSHTKKIVATEDHSHLLAISRKQFPDIVTNDRGMIRLLKTGANLKFLIDWYGITLKYNLYIKDITIVVPHLDEVVDNDGKYLEIQSLCGLNDWLINKDFVISVARQYALSNSYNEIAEWLQSNEIDPGRDAIKDLFKCLPLEPSQDPELLLEMFKKWMIQCCAAADSSARTTNSNAVAKYESVLVLSGGQGNGKTKFWSNLLPKNLRRYIVDGLMLDLKSVDSLRIATSSFICELGELDSTFRKSDISQLKAFLSKQVDEYRLPYGIDVNKHHRRTSFCASVNGTDFLQDMTGNRRFWIIEIDGEIRQPEIELIEAAWADAWQHYINGVAWWFDDYHTIMQLNRHADTFHAIHEDPIIARVLQQYGSLSFETMNADKSVWMTTIEILQSIGEDRPARGDTIRLSAYLKSIAKDSYELRQIRKVFSHSIRKFKMPKIRNKSE